MKDKQENKGQDYNILMKYTKQNKDSSGKRTCYLYSCQCHYQQRSISSDEVYQDLLNTHILP